MRIYGVDFTSAPSARKPITAARCTATGDRLRVEEIEQLPDFVSFEHLLRRPGPWVGGFDFPFGLSRQAVTGLAWPDEWRRLLHHCRWLGRAEFKRQLDAYRESRPPGSRYAARGGDLASGAHPSVKLVNPPVGLMFFEGAWRLACAGLHVPGLQVTDDSRVALEAYPGLLVRRQLALPAPYKNDSARQQTSARRRVREQILAALEAGQPLGVRVTAARDVGAQAIDDGTGDRLDAIVCAVQACWGWRRKDEHYGLPARLDPIEGWIVSAT